LGSGAPQRRPLPPPPWSEQSFLHEPQRCAAPSTSVSQPSSASGAGGSAQLPKPSLHVDVQRPLSQARDATLAPEQARPHAPQLATSAPVAVSQPSSAAGAAGCTQLPKPALQLELHTPPLQARDATEVVAQARSQAPQWSVLVERSVSQPFAISPSQSPSEPGQLPIAHFPALQAGVPLGVVHTLPHAPQFRTSPRIAVSQASSAAGAAGCRQSPRVSHTARQVPASQRTDEVPVFWQARPHAPQLSALVRGSVSQPLLGTPSQFKKPPVQLPTRQTPPTQVAVAFGRLHELPQNPQLFGSDARLVSQPLLVLLSQSIRPGAQAFSPQVPPLHVAAAPGVGVQTLGQLPQ